MNSFTFKAVVAHLVCAVVVTAQATEFDHQALYTKANENAKSEVGKAYDEALSKGFNAQPKLMEQVNACIKANPGVHQVSGYFYIPADANYQVHLMPQSAFADCLGKAMVGFRVPKPPELPWVNVFHFSNAPKAEAANVPASAASATRAAPQNK